MTRIFEAHCSSRNPDAFGDLSRHPEATTPDTGGNEKWSNICLPLGAEPRKRSKEKDSWEAKYVLTLIMCTSNASTGLDNTALQNVSVSTIRADAAVETTCWHAHAARIYCTIGVKILQDMTETVIMM